VEGVTCLALPLPQAANPGDSRSWLIDSRNPAIWFQSSPERRVVSVLAVVVCVVEIWLFIRRLWAR
jgi:hypothetical protein